jgi:hypothetical protein
MAGLVETAIRSKISPCQRLKTPDIHKSASFEVKCLNIEGMVLLFGKKKTPTNISWQCLEGIPAFLKGKDWVKVGTVFDTSANPSTLDEYLKGWIKRGTAGWVAAVLEKAGIVEIDRHRPIRVRLK